MLGTYTAWTLEAGALEAQHHGLRHEALIMGRMQTRGISALDLGGSATPRRRWLAWFVLAGEARLLVEGNQLLVRAGEVAFVDARTSRLCGTSSDVDLLGLNYNLRPTADGLGRQNRADFGRASAADCSELRRVANELCALARTPTDPSARWAVGQRALHVLGLARQLAGASVADAISPRERALSRAVMRCTMNLKQQPSIEDVAGTVGISPGRVSRLLGDYFKKYHGSFDGWRSYLSTMRVELAWGLLQTRATTAKWLAEWLGYRSSSALYHALERRGLKVDELPRPLTSWRRKAS